MILHSVGYCNYVNFTMNSRNQQKAAELIIDAVDDFEIMKGSASDGEDVTTNETECLDNLNDSMNNS